MWTGRRAMIGAGVATLALAGGAWAGMDAAGQVDGAYRFTPGPRWQAVAVEPVVAPPDEWPNAPIAAAPPLGSIWGQGIGRAERAFFDTDVATMPADERLAPVRVHRGHRARTTFDQPAPVELPTVEAGDGVEDGWVGAPADSVTNGPAPAA